MSTETAVIVPPGSLAAWMVAARPRSLAVAVGPVLVGAAFAWQRTGAFDAGRFLLILLASVLVQVICNFQNDVGYTVRGGERRGTRTGLPRATAQGWLAIPAVRTAIAALVLVALALGSVLVWQCGWPVAVFGAASLAAAVAYMGGPRPIAYTPFGEATVFVFFGLIAVTGTDWVLTGDTGAATIAGACASGALAAAALAVNNHRDRAHDAEAGRRTFAVICGAQASCLLYALLLGVPFLLCAAIAYGARAPVLLLPCVLLPAAVRLLRDFVGCAPGLAYNGVLFRTFRMGLRFSLLLAAGAVLDRAW